MALLPSESRALSAYTTWLRQRFGERLRELVLFGSRARSEAHEDSDVDLLVVIDDLDDGEGREIAHAAGDILTEYDVLVSPLTLSSERMAHLRAHRRRIAIEIERDGVPL